MRAFLGGKTAPKAPKGKNRKRKSIRPVDEGGSGGMTVSGGT